MGGSLGGDPMRLTLYSTGILGGPTIYGNHQSRFIYLSLRPHKHVVGELTGFLNPKGPRTQIIGL